ncbi:MAG: TerC family protein [Archangiaceae bacterium]|nr:TerC family protein [Archangiaceae bacterium]
MGTPALWVGFFAVVVVLIGIDLRAVKVRGGSVSTKGAAMWVGLWVLASLGFAGFLHYLYGTRASAPFLTAWVLEYALSVDNLFVFVLVFGYFKVRPDAQHRLLYWGVLGAFFLRAVLIGAGAVAIARFHWLLYGFGAFLLYTAWKLLFTGENDEEVDPENNPVLKWARRVLPVAKEDHGIKFLAIEAGKRVVTPLFLILLVVETTDLIFALDSIPAALGVSQDMFVVFTSNVCAILGLRSLFFVVSSLMDKFHYLKVGLGIILAFVGLKICAETFWAAELDPYDVPLIIISLSFVAVTLVASVLASVIWPPKKADAQGPIADDRRVAGEPASIAARREGSVEDRSLEPRE